mmetsp:Transcript_269/g.152  ORF Transcript_269/g.152 Transcript_269/m.152 type:complete len:189 (+) Transcript_269:53-619(+)
MNPFDIIDEYYFHGSLAYEVLIEHSRLVKEKAVCIAKSKEIACFNPDVEFIREAAMLHDIGIYLTDAPDIGCSGEYPYICHGYLGRKILEKKGFKRHALVCECHTGAGLLAKNIKKANLPLPVRDMIPISVEEQIICYADKFFSKGENIPKQKTIDQIRFELGKFGIEQVKRFDSWAKIFQNVFCVLA